MVSALFDTNILIDHLNAIPQAREEIGRFENRAVSIITWMEVMVGADADLVEPTRRSGRAVTVDGDPTVLTPAELDAIDAVVSTAQVAIALSGTIILDAGPGQGRRAITLVPDFHLIVLYADQIVQTVPEAIARLDPLRPLTMIAGPSATSDSVMMNGAHSCAASGTMGSRKRRKP